LASKVAAWRSAHDHRTDRHLADQPGVLGLVEGDAHRAFVVGGGDVAHRDAANFSVA